MTPKPARRLAAYAATAAATAATTQGTANAATFIHDIPDITVGQNESVWFNLVNGNTLVDPTFQPTNPLPAIDGRMRLIGRSTTYVNPYLFGQVANNVKFAATAAVTDSAAGLLGVGDSIDVSLNFVADGPFSGSSYANLGDDAAWGDNTRGFVGITFQIGGATHYGWADITRTPNPSEATLHAFGYEDVAGQAAYAGGSPVPEPSSLILLAAGAAGLGGWRKRKSA